ncbi:relaxase/mobilization nuclease domain-containing protein [Salinispora arenicola]|uniref:relaxase/mobilization nuclease domain-containing protein n=1 Tax=Salinispora arenicola TaxID=168697 RepID=UPI0012FBA01F|nr:relaxase/mobilization nuclease domain-containing protein [Salinispora arenicola]
MIGRVLPRGQRVAGLVRYLYGPGKAEEHRDPHIVASWTGETTSLEPLVTADGHRDFRRLVGALQALLEEQPEWRREPKPVYHVAVRAAVEDRVLSDREWSEIATEMMHHVGLSRREAPESGVRWIAVRHADDHIHIVATLARQDGRAPRRDNDWHRVREACRLFEQRYGLRSTAPADITAARRPHRAEVEKALRTGRHETARDKLRREVRAAAAAAGSESEFFSRLEKAGVMVRLRESTVTAGEVTGYAVTLPGVRTTNGAPVWYGGGRLAADLTLPKLRQRWSPATTASDASPPQPRQGEGVHARDRVLDDAAQHASRAADTLRRNTRDSPEAAAIAYASADAMTSAARVIEGARGGPLTLAADRYDHAARERYGKVPPRRHGRSEHLRSSARLLAALRRVRVDSEALRVAELLSQLAALAETLELMRSAQRRVQQATAARDAAVSLRAQATRYSRRVSTDSRRHRAPTTSRRTPSTASAPTRHPPAPPRGPATPSR